jgi:thiol-disulfide isomerase/thioredoxin
MALYSPNRTGGASDAPAWSRSGDFEYTVESRHEAPCLEASMSIVSVLLTLSLSAAPGVRFVEDDYAKALAQAKAQKKLLFVDAWAPWCHTCIFMREHVLNRPSFKAFEKRVVFAAIDTEKKKNEAFVSKFPVANWPTLFFIDPNAEAVRAKFAGAVDEQMLKAMLSAAENADSKEDSRADSAAQNATPRASFETLSMLLALTKAKEFEKCAQLSLDAVSESDVERAAFAQAGLACALDIADDKAKTAMLAKTVPKAREALTLPGAFADDVSSTYEVLVDERVAAKDDAGAQAMAAQWLSFLERQANAAKTPAARAVFDPHRVNAALAMKSPERAVEALRQSRKDFPKDYNPPARLALLYLEMGETKLADALSSIDLALSLCQEGPRKVRLFVVKSTVQNKLQKSAEAEATLLQAKAYVETLPAAQRTPALVAQLDSALAMTRKK